MSILERQQEIIQEFAMFDDWMDKYSYIIDLGNSLPPIDAKYKSEDNLIKGCQSQVWFHAEYKNGLLYFEGDSDAIITKGIAGIMVRVFSGSSPEEIINANLGFIDEIGLSQHLSPTRSSGLMSMVKQIKYYAIAYSSQKQ